MSGAPQVLCQAGCGDFGDPELDFLCGDCHGDKVEIEKQRALLEYVDKKMRKTSVIAETIPLDSPTRRGPPSIDHRKALDEFMGRHREKDALVVARECLFLERETQIRETSKRQLRKFMIATDVDEPVDPKEWGRYRYGAPRDIPRHDIDEATELAAQLKLFCHWRRKAVNRRVATRKQLMDEQGKADKKKKKQQNKAKRALAVPKLPSISLRGLRKSASARVLTAATPEQVAQQADPTPKEA
ncbi:hypothetical protein Poli38472_000817 [Pythium oligandrum]|uniref:A20-type domain-containing protein n=1 Tax=Pythium oligandrum TaxID=41045 RepID=A0A8K1CCT9_PYTOL|nr:hypothetical protein Poli38472_000817 [Pythium oligandrum]|eukprot:TMW60775.1 hypothetical protein Poli38472_000817 [Pythium oligandrum]